MNATHHLPERTRGTSPWGGPGNLFVEMTMTRKTMMSANERGLVAGWRALFNAQAEVRAKFGTEDEFLRHQWAQHYRNNPALQDEFGADGEQKFVAMAMHELRQEAES